MKYIRFILIKLLTWFFVFIYPIERKKVFSKNMKKAVNLYADGGFDGLFAKIRMWDAPYKEIEKTVPKKGIIVDLGSGDGLFSNYLAIESARRKIIGLENNGERVKRADKGLKNTIFKKADILNANLPKAECFLLIHVFHHLPKKSDQKKLLLKIRKDIKGSLIVAEISEKPFLKFIFSVFTDFLIVPILFGDKLVDTNVHYRKDKEWRRLFTECGFEVKRVSFPHRGMPFSHVLYECKRSS